MPQVVDEPGRARAKRELEKNLVVEAGAGTGKTTLLITRLCVALLVKNVPVEKLVAVTFTIKAASEIKLRLIAALEGVRVLLQRQLSSQPNPEVASQPDKYQAILNLIHQEWGVRCGLTAPVLLERATHALHHIDRAYIGTIHGFCAYLLRKFPLEAGLPPDFKVDEGNEANRLFNAQWQLFLTEELREHTAGKELWKTVLAHISLEELKQFARTLAGGKTDDYSYEMQAQALQQLCEQYRTQLTGWECNFLPTPKTKPRAVEKAIAWAQTSLQRSALFFKWIDVQSGRGRIPLTLQAVAQCIAQLSPALELEKPFVDAAPTGWKEDTARQQAFAKAKQIIAFAQAVVPENQQLFLQCLALVRTFVHRVRQELVQKQGIVLFDDLIIKTRNLLKNHPQVRRILKDEFAALFIDEFQDTDPMQGEIFLFLAETKEGQAPSWKEVRLEPGKLFVVGDPKQSIYRFRGADMEAYTLFTRLIVAQGGETCVLEQNFRSVPGVVQAANEVCAPVFDRQRTELTQGAAAYQAMYQPIVPVRDITPLQPVQWLFIDNPLASKVPPVDDFRHNQAQFIVSWIQERVNQTPSQAVPPVSYRDITLLFRSLSSAGVYISALRRAHIPFELDDPRHFFRRQEVNDFLNILRVLANPHDKTALVGVLRSPWGGCNDAQLYELAQREELVLSVTPSLEVAQRCYVRLRAWAQKAHQGELTEFLHAFMDQSFFPEVCAAAYEGETTLTVLSYLVHIAENYAAKTVVTLPQLIIFLQEFIDVQMQKEESAQLNAVGSERDAVSIMTVHKSKGLEFPIVILPDLSHATSGAHRRKQIYYQWAQGFNGLRVGPVCDGIFAYLESEEQRHAWCEEMRILYVALTRAKEQLVLVGNETAPMDIYIPKSIPQALVFAKQLPPPQGANAETEIPVRRRSYQDPNTFLWQAVPSPSKTPCITAQAVTQWMQQLAQRKARYQAVLSAQEMAPSARVEWESVPNPAHEIGAQVGTLCHEILCTLFKTPTACLSALVAGARVRFTPQVVQEAAPVLTSFIQTPLYKELQSCEVLACEMPFAQRTSGGQVVSGIMDVILRDPKGKIWVVDYKTDHIPAGGVDNLLDKYRPQLSVYAQAARQIFKTDVVRCSAVFVRAGVVKDL